MNPTSVNSTCTEITKFVGNNPESAHAFGYCAIPSDIDSSGVSFLLHGGCSWSDYTHESSCFNNFCVYHPTLKRFRNLPPPENTGFRYRHSVVLRYQKSRRIKELYLYGGVVEPDFTKDFFMFDLNRDEIYDDVNRNEIYEDEDEDEFDENEENRLRRGTWTTLNFTGQDELEVIGFHTALYNMKLDRMYIFGGKNLDGRRNILLTCDLENRTWKRYETPITPDVPWPSRRAGHTQNWIDETSFIVFGGMDADDQDLNESWIYNCVTKRWKFLEYTNQTENENEESKMIPSPRASHCSAFCGDFLYVHGGASVRDKEDNDENGVIPFVDKYIVHNDLFRLNIGTRRWERIEINGNLPIPAYIRILCPYMNFFPDHSNLHREANRLEDEDDDDDDHVLTPMSSSGQVRYHHHSPEDRFKIVCIGGLALDRDDNLMSMNRMFSFEFLFTNPFEKMKEVGRIRKKKLYHFMPTHSEFQFWRNLLDCKKFRDIRIVTRGYQDIEDDDGEEEKSNIIKKKSRSRMIDEDAEEEEEEEDVNSIFESLDDDDKMDFVVNKRKRIEIVNNYHQRKKRKMSGQQ